MKLSADLILSSPSYINAINSRELLLRGRQIPQIENLGVTRDLNDVLDLTDNDITVLGNFPRLLRLKCILAARNRISHIHPSLSETLPNLESLVLSNNSISQLADLDALSGLPKLTDVCLIDNIVTLKPNYRLYVIWRNPHIRFLDFERVKDAERSRALELFGALDAPNALALEIQGQRPKSANVFNINGNTNNKRGIAAKLSDAEKERLRESLKNATSLAEIEKIEKQLAGA